MAKSGDEPSAEDRRAAEILESIGDAFFALDRDGRFTWANREAERVLGRPREELLGRNVGHALPEAVLPAFQQQCERAFEEGRTARFEAAWEPLGAWFYVRVHPFVAGLSVYLLDITDRKRVEGALRQGEERFREISENIQEVFWMFEPGFTRTVYVSPAYEEIWGRPVESLYADPASFVTAIHPDDVQAVEAAMRWVGEDVLDGVTYRVRRPDGDVRWVWSRGYPIRDEQGRVTCVVGTSLDITGRKRAEEALQASEAHYRRLVENAPYAVYALDAEGRFIELNPAGERIVGLAAEDVLGKHFSEVIAPADLPVATDGFERVVSGEADDIEFEERIRQPSGDERLIRVTESAIREGGTIVGTHGIARDITDEVERDKTLRRAERLASVGTLIGGVAHELNNPLHAIRNFAELMLMKEREADDQEALSIIQREADRAAKIVADLRLIARETQEAEGPGEAVDLNDVVRHVVKVRRYALETGNVEIREDLAKDLPSVLAKRGEVEQALLNLVVNAEQAMAGQEGERRLILRSRRTAEGASVDVVDSGPGISSAHLSQVFDPFFTTKDPGEGTGLGLSLVHSIITERGGNIRVDSEPGKGTAFRIELPLAEAEPPPPTGGRMPAAGRALRILVVDDEEAIRRVSARFLERLGHRVDVAADGEQALGLLEHTDYDVILSDLRMPGLGGEQLLQRLRERGGGLERRLTFMTGDAASAEAARIISEAGVPVLVKPMGLDELARAVEYAGRARPADREEER